MNVWFTSDTHFFHKNAIALIGRPFRDVDEMNEEMIKRWNERVKPQDDIYHLGDVSFGNREDTLSILPRLNGHVHYVFGNHDHILKKVLKEKPHLAASAQDYKEIRVEGKRFVLFHFPILSWHNVHHGWYHLHGHCHGNLKYKNGKMLDVGVDAFGEGAPVAFEEVIDALNDREWEPVDQHDENNKG